MKPVVNTVEVPEKEWETIHGDAPLMVFTLRRQLPRPLGREVKNLGTVNAPYVIEPCPTCGAERGVLRERGRPGSGEFFMDCLGCRSSLSIGVKK